MSDNKKKLREALDQMCDWIVGEMPDETKLPVYIKFDAHLGGETLIVYRCEITPEAPKIPHPSALIDRR